MTADLLLAVQILQSKNSQFFTSSPYWTERIDRAINSLLNTPGHIGYPPNIVRNALSDAGKNLRRRQELLPIVDIKEVDKDGTPIHRKVELIPDPSAQSTINYVELELWLDQICLSPTDRAILQILLQGGEAEEVRKHFNISLPQARVRVSRVRSRVWTIWKGECS